MKRLIDAVLRHRVLVALAWLAVAVAGVATAPSTLDRLSYDFALPGQPAYEANQEILKQYGGGGLNEPLLLVVEGAGFPRLLVRGAAVVQRTAVGEHGWEFREFLP